MRAYPVWLAVTILAFVSFAQSQEITDIYSNIESADVTVSGDVAHDLLQLDLLFKDQVLQTKQISLDGPGTWISTWDSFEAEKGPYQVCAALQKDGKKQSERCYKFFMLVRFRSGSMCEISMPTPMASISQFYPKIQPLSIFTIC